AVPQPASHASSDAVARLMLVALSLAWGLTWPIMKIALDEIPPFSFRTATSGLACAILFAVAFAQHRNIGLKNRMAGVHLVVTSFLSVGVFTLGSAFGQLATTTSRVSVLTYTMPIWAALLARPVLGERLNAMRGISLLLCAAGLAVLIYPLIGSRHLIGVAIAITTAVAWAAGTVYFKWARVEAGPLAIAALQLVGALSAPLIRVTAVAGALHLLPLHLPAA